jgi:hypothetical protein
MTPRAVLIRCEGIEKSHVPHHRDTAPRLIEAVAGFKAGAYVRDVIKLCSLGFLAVLFLSPALLPMPAVPHERGRLMPLLATAAEAQERSWQTTAPEKTPGQTAVTVGMRKEAVRALWGEPVEIGKIRTCFGTKEEWVFQGDLQRFGARERILHFDEDEVLTEIR